MKIQIMLLGLSVLVKTAMADPNVAPNAPAVSPFANPAATAPNAAAPADASQSSSSFSIMSLFDSPKPANAPVNSNPAVLVSAGEGKIEKDAAHTPKNSATVLQVEPPDQPNAILKNEKEETVSTVLVPEGEEQQKAILVEHVEAPKAPVLYMETELKPATVIYIEDEDDFGDADDATKNLLAKNQTLLMEEPKPKPAPPPPPPKKKKGMF